MNILRVDNSISNRKMKTFTERVLLPAPDARLYILKDIVNSIGPK